MSLQIPTQALIEELNKAESLQSIGQKVGKWDRRYLGLAKHISEWSRDPSTKVGAVIVDPRNQIVSLGFNGLPRGVEDSDARLSDRPTKYKMIVHAETNALAFAERSVHGCTVYTYPFMPCCRCAGAIIQAGIREVVAPMLNNVRWAEDFALSQQMFNEANVQLRLLTDTL